jgi:DNA-binding response OmpR family regulator
MVRGLFFSGASEESARAARPLRILVVDDSRDQVLTLMAILRDEGYETRGAYSGKEALAAISEFDPDAVIADLSMPGMSGWDLAREVRSTGYETRPFMIAISGEYRANADKVLSHMVGFNHYLVKPCSPDDVLALLRPLKLPG